MYYFSGLFRKWPNINICWLVNHWRIERDRSRCRTDHIYIGVYSYGYCGNERENTLFVGTEFDVFVGIEFDVFRYMKNFCWLGMHGSLPTNAFRGSRHHTIETTCHRCGVVIEDDIQTPRDCPNAMSIWRFIYDKITLEILCQAVIK